MTDTTLQNPHRPVAFDRANRLHVHHHAKAHDWLLQIRQIRPDWCVFASFACVQPFLNSLPQPRHASFSSSKESRAGK